jgi:hypothetical protein
VIAMVVLAAFALAGLAAALMLPDETERVTLRERK